LRNEGQIRILTEDQKDKEKEKDKTDLMLDKLMSQSFPNNF